MVFFQPVTCTHSVKAENEDYLGTVDSYDLVLCAIDILLEKYFNMWVKFISNFFNVKEINITLNYTSKCGIWLFLQGIAKIIFLRNWNSTVTLDVKDLIQNKSIEKAFLN